MRRRASKTPLVFFVFTLLYFFTASGYVDTTDAEPSLDTAKALFQRGSLAVFPGVTGTYFEFQRKRGSTQNYYYARSENGAWYTKLGLTLPLCYVPAVALGTLLSKDPIRSELFTRAAASLLNGFLTAILLMVFFGFFRSTTDKKTAVFLTACLGVGTLLFPYAKMSHRESLQALCLAMAFLAFYPGKPLRTRDFFLSGSAIAIGTLTKQAFLIPAFPLLLFAFIRAREQAHHKKALLLLLAPLLICAAIWALYADQAFGGYFKTGYSPAVVQGHRAIWSTPFWEGIRLQFFSWEWSLFLYSPLLLLPVLLFAVDLLKARASAFQLVVVSSILLQAAAYATWVSPIGKEALGPRFLVVVIPLFFLIFQPRSFATLSKGQRAASVTLFLVSGLLQLSFISVKPQLYWALAHEAKDSSPPPQWLVSLSIFKRKLEGRPEVYQLSELGFDSDKEISLLNHPTLLGLNFWWRHTDQIARLDSGKEKAARDSLLPDSVTAPAALP